MGVFPTRLGFADKTSTYASAEQFLIAQARYTIAPWARRLDQSASVALLGDEPDVYAAHDLNGLMRGTAADRAQFYAAMVTNGIMTRNEVRTKEDLNPLTSLDEPLTPLNTGGADPGASNRRVEEQTATKGCPRLRACNSSSPSIRVETICSPK